MTATDHPNLQRRPVDYAAAGRKGGQASAISRRQATLRRAERAEMVETAVDLFDDLNIGSEMLESAMKLVRGAASGTLPIPETPLERKQLADAAKVIFYMARLQLGESTQNVAHATVEDLRAKRLELEGRLAALAGDGEVDTPTD